MYYYVCVVLDGHTRTPYPHCVCYGTMVLSPYYVLTIYMISPIGPMLTHHLIGFVRWRHPGRPSLTLLAPIMQSNCLSLI